MRSTRAATQLNAHVCVHVVQSMQLQTGRERTDSSIASELPGIIPLAGFSRTGRSDPRE
uniref:Uncharacterized protein n=1 Tax=Neospora caninum (strain Liverpool) TaxID=572307 RepID=A0A0F7U8A3_NEOCL|nr:TPA: hypothetical protein BN1204_007275 [Neospora caninum Liverpool]